MREGDPEPTSRNRSVLLCGVIARPGWIVLPSQLGPLCVPLRDVLVNFGADRVHGVRASDNEQRIRASGVGPGL